MLLQQDVQRLAIDAIHPQPRTLSRDDLVEHHTIETPPVGGQDAPVDGKALGAVHRLAHAQKRPAEIGAGALDVEGERPDGRQ